MPITSKDLDWFQKFWYRTGVNDEKIRQIHERLEGERLAREKQKSPQS